jgi:hypothetical protein
MSKLNFALATVDNNTDVFNYAACNKKTEEFLKLACKAVYDLPELDEDVIRETLVSSLNQAFRTSSKRKATSTRTTPAKKQAPSSYILFCADYRKQIAGDYTGQSIAAVGKACGEKWNNMSEDERRPYVERFQELKKQLEEAVAAEQDAC